MLEDAHELFSSLSGELIVAEIKHLEVSVHGKSIVRLERHSDMRQIFVGDVASTKEENLELLSLSDELCKRTEFFGCLVVFGGWDLIDFVCTDGNRVTRLEVLSVNWVPVEEKVSNWAVVLSKVVSKSLELRNR